MKKTVCYDPNYYPLPSQRMVVYGSKGMVCTSQSLAAQAGLEILKRGGNAVDAAVATAAALTVVEPTSNGIGSDAFALIWKDGRLHGMNASGAVPRALSMETARQQGWADKGTMPPYGWAPVTVPMAPAAWAGAVARHGRLSLAEVLAPAVSYARDGHALGAVESLSWGRAYKKYRAQSGEEFKNWFETFAPEGRAPQAGEIWRSEAHARTLEKIAASNGRDFYQGSVAEMIAAAAKAGGGSLSAADLGEAEPEWVSPIKVNYHGYDVWEIPPNGQGIAALVALSILDGFAAGDRTDPLTVHRQIEAMKMGFADAHRYVADRRFADVPVEGLLSKEYGASRRALIGGTAEERQAGTPLSGGTVYLCTADGEGNMVSWIQSNYMGFGSGIVIPGAGVSLNNRGHCASLQEGHPNMLEPGKRPYNTIIPGFLTKDGLPVGPFGVMGGFMQPQGHVQAVMNTVDFMMNPQQALDAPRWQWTGGCDVSVEQAFPSALAQKLIRMGHKVTVDPESISFGRGEIIWNTEHGTLAGATEPRTDGAVAAW